MVLPLTDLLVPLVVEGGGRRLPGRAVPPGGPLISPLGMHLQGISVARIESYHIIEGGRGGR